MSDREEGVVVGRALPTVVAPKKRGHPMLSAAAEEEARHRPGRRCWFASGYLSEVRVCYEKVDGSGAVGGRMACPDVILREDNCGDQIEIASFDDDDNAMPAAEMMTIE